MSLGGGPIELPVLLRLNPDVAPETSPGLAVGLASSKFGLSADDLEILAASDVWRGGLRLRGIHVHMGSHLSDVAAWAVAGRRAVDLLARVRQVHRRPDDLDVVDAHLEAVVRRHLDGGPHVDLGGELEGLVVLEPGDVDLGLRQRLQVVVLQRLDVELRQRLVDRLVEDRTTTDLPVDDRRRLFYTLTAPGERLLAAEARRLASLVASPDVATLIDVVNA